VYTIQSGVSTTICADLLRVDAKPDQFCGDREAQADACGGGR
jgi:hypothetical protein